MAALLGPLLAACASEQIVLRPAPLPARPGPSLVFRSPELIAADREAGYLSDIEHAEYARRNRALGVRRVRDLPPEPPKAAYPTFELIPPGRPELWYVW